MAKMGLNAASLPNSLSNSLGNSGGVDLSANLATSRVLASNNLAAQQVRLYPCQQRPVPCQSALFGKSNLQCIFDDMQ